MTDDGATIAVRTQQGSAPIRSAEWEERRTRLTQLLAGIAEHADVQMLGRCPYRNRLDQCTSSFDCRNKRKPERPDQLPRCAEDGGIDYRSAWEAKPDGYEPLRRALRGAAKRNVPARETLRAER